MDDKTREMIERLVDHLEGMSDLCDDGHLMYTSPATGMTRKLQTVGLRAACKDAQVLLQGAS